MEHIVQFGIGIDDDAIVKKVTESAAKQITEDLKHEVRGQLFNIDRIYYGRENVNGLSRWAECKFDEFLKENKDEIIELAVARLADKMYKSKAVKEAMGDVISKGE